MIEHEGNTLGFDEVLIPGARQQVVDQGGYIADVHTAVAVYVTTLEVLLRGEVARVAGAAVDVGVGLVPRVGVAIGSALAAHQAGAAVEHICRVRHGRSAPAIAHIDGPQIAAVSEHTLHVCHIRGVETAQIKVCQAAAAPEHAYHMGYSTCVQIV